MENVGTSHPAHRKASARALYLPHTTDNNNREDVSLGTGTETECGVGWGKRISRNELELFPRFVVNATTRDYMIPVGNVYATRYTVMTCQTSVSKVSR